MQLADHYDCIVLGTSPSAWLSASLAAHLGLSVCVLPLGNRAFPQRSAKGLGWDPEPNSILGLESYHSIPGLLRECLKAFKKGPPLEPLILNSCLVPQVLTPFNRLTLQSGDQLIPEMFREFGPSFLITQSLVSAFQNTEASHLKFWITYFQEVARPVKKTDKIPKIESALQELRTHLVSILKASNPLGLLWLKDRQTLEQSTEAEWGLVSQGLHYEVTANLISRPSLFMALHLFSFSRTGRAFSGGIEGFRQYLQKTAVELGVKVYDSKEAFTLKIESGHLKGFTVAGRKSPIHTSFGIIGCPLKHLKVPSSSYLTLSRLRTRPPRIPVGWRFTIALQVPLVAIPKKMEARSVWQEKDAPPLEIEIADPATYSQVMGQKEEASARQPNQRWIFLRTPLAFHKESLDKAFQQRIARRMIKKASELLPFLNEHLLSVYPELPPHSGQAVPSSDRDWEAVYPYTSLEMIPDNLLVLGGGRRGEGIGITSTVKGLFVASQESYPSLGSLGPTLATLQSLVTITRALDKPFTLF